MKSANNPFNLHVGDHVVVKSSNLVFNVIGFTQDGYPNAEHGWLRSRGIRSSFIESVTREKGG